MFIFIIYFERVLDAIYEGFRLIQALIQEEFIYLFSDKNNGFIFYFILMLLPSK